MSIKKKRIINIYESKANKALLCESLGLLVNLRVTLAKQKTIRKALLLP